MITTLVFLLFLSTQSAFGQTITLQWTQNSNNETGFRVERNASGGSFSQGVEVGQDVETWQDTSVSFDIPYCYKVRSYNDAGNSAFSNTACATPTAQAPNPVLNLSCDPAPSAPVLAMSLNAGSGTIAADTSGANNPGTLTGPTWTNSGKFGKALSFDGVNDWVTVNDANSLDLTTGLTLSAWVYPSTVTSWRTVLLKEQAGELVYSLYAADGSNRPTAILAIGTTKQYLSGLSALPLNTWSYLAVTYDGAQYRLYVNGTQVAARAQTGQIVTSTGALRIGGNSVWNNEFYKGRIDEVRIYNRALSAAEITTDKNTAIP